MSWLTLLPPWQRLLTGELVNSVASLAETAHGESVNSVASMAETVHG